MTTYRAGGHHGVTICREGDGFICGREDHDCARGHLVAVIVNDDWALAKRIASLLNGPPYPARCTLEPGVRGCVCQPWPDCAVAQPNEDAPGSRAVQPESVQNGPAVPQGAPDVPGGSEAPAWHQGCSGCWRTIWHGTVS